MKDLMKLIERLILENAELKDRVKGFEENYKFMEDCYNAERQTVMDLRNTLK